MPILATYDFVSQSDLSDICVQVKKDYLPKSALLMAVDTEEQLVGFMGMMNGHEIESLFIDPTCHRRGLGRAFTEEASAQSPHLEVGVNAQNSQAVAFYEAVGFTAYTSPPIGDDGRSDSILRMRR